jgi:hypothetical protein
MAIQRALGTGSMVRAGQTRTGGMDESRVIWTGLERAFKEMQKEGRGIAVLENGLSMTTSDENEESFEISGLNLLELAKEGKDGLDGVSPTAWFWRECATGLDRRIREACRSNNYFKLTYNSVTIYGEDITGWIFSNAKSGERHSHRQSRG